MPVEAPLPVKLSPASSPATAEAPAGTEIQALYDQYVVPTVNRGLTLTRGTGRYVWDDEGRKYLDLGGGVAVNSLGHAHPAIRETLARQADVLIHNCNLYYNEWQGPAAERDGAPARARQGLLFQHRPGGPERPFKHP